MPDLHFHLSLNSTSLRIVKKKEAKRKSESLIILAADQENVPGTFHLSVVVCPGNTYVQQP